MKAAVLKKYGVIAGIVALLLIVSAVLMNYEGEKNAAIAKEKEEVLQLQKQRDQEATRMQKLQVEADRLKKERDAAVAERDVLAKRNQMRLLMHLIGFNITLHDYR